MKLHPQLEATLDALGATPTDKELVLGFFLDQYASHQSRVQGFASQIENLQRQQAEAQVDADVVGAMLSRFAVEDDPVEDDPLTEEPAPEEPPVEDPPLDDPAP